MALAFLLPPIAAGNQENIEDQLVIELLQHLLLFLPANTDTAGTPIVIAMVTSGLLTGLLNTDVTLSPDIVAIPCCPPAHPHIMSLS